MEIRDTRNGNWYWVNTAVNACPHLTHAEKSVYGALSSFGGCKEVRPTFQQIAERSNTTERFAMKAIKRLTELGLLGKETKGGRGHANIYNLLKCPNGCIKCQKGEQKNSVSVDTKRVNKKHKKGVDLNTPIDKNIDNTCENKFSRENSKKEEASLPSEEEEISSVAIDEDGYEIEEKKKDTRRVKDKEKIFYLFSKYKQPWWYHKQQKEAALRLFDMIGYEKVEEAMRFYHKYKDDPYCPQVSTPYKLEEKYENLRNFRDSIYG